MTIRKDVYAIRSRMNIWKQWRQKHPDRIIDLKGACLDGKDVAGADLIGADLTDAKLVETDLTNANLMGANLSNVDLTKADLSEALLLRTNFTHASLIDCSIHGVSEWGVQLEGATQRNLAITAYNEPRISIDNLKVAQFIYTLLDNQEIRNVIDTVAKKAVLLLGRFTPKRKAILNALMEALRTHEYVPILFDFEKPASRDMTETVSTLAHLARFIIADLTGPRSIPKELKAIVPTLAVPVQPLLQGSIKPYSMFRDYWKYPWVLEPYRYKGLEGLLASLEEHVIGPAERKAKELPKLRAEKSMY